MSAIRVSKDAPIRQHSAPAARNDIESLIKEDFRKTSKEIPVDIDYLVKLVSESNLRLEDVKSILLSRKGNDELIRLFIVSLFTKIKNRHLMSPRYFDFYNRIIQLVKNGSLKLNIKQVKFGEKFTMSNYDRKNDTLSISFLPSDIKSPGYIQKLEESTIHELYHAYQDFKKDSMTHSFSEAEAHTASNDYRLHAYPQICNSSWIRIIDKDIFSLGFSIPKELISKMSAMNPASKAYMREMEDIAKKYMQVEAFLVLFYSPEVRDMKDRFLSNYRNHKLGSSEDVAYRFQEIINAFIESDEQHLTMVDNGRISYVPSRKLMAFLFVARVIVDQKRRAEKSIDPRMTTTQKCLDDMFGLFCKKITNLDPGNQKIDPFLQRDGIKPGN